MLEKTLKRSFVLFVRMCTKLFLFMQQFFLLTYKRSVSFNFSVITYVDRQTGKKKMTIHTRGKCTFKYDQNNFFSGDK